MMLYFVIFSAICGWSVQAIPCNVITLQHGKEVTCLAPIEETIDVRPPIELSEEMENGIFEKKWENGDWILQNGNSMNYAAIADKRWEDFPTVRTQRLTCDATKAAESFSVYEPKQISMFIISNGESKRLINDREPKSTTSWIHYTVLRVLQNNIVFVFENNHLIQELNMDDLNPTVVVVVTNETTYWKKHNYSPMTSERVSEAPSTIIIPPVNKSGLFLYTSLCTNCSLELEININNETRQIIINATENEQSMLKPWQQIKIDIDLTNGASLTFLRKLTTENESLGFWGLDIKLYPDIRSGFGTYTYKSASNSSEVVNHTCYGLNMAKDEVNNNEKSEKLEKNCDMSCEEIVGADSKFCENYRFCVNTARSCAWGFEGMEYQNKTRIVRAIIAIATVFAVIFVVGFMVFFYIWKKRRRNRCGVDNDEERGPDLNTRVPLFEN